MLKIPFQLGPLFTILFGYILTRKLKGIGNFEEMLEKFSDQKKATYKIILGEFLETIRKMFRKFWSEFPINLEKTYVNFSVILKTFLRNNVFISGNFWINLKSFAENLEVILRGGDLRKIRGNRNINSWSFWIILEKLRKIRKTNTGKNSAKFGGLADSFSKSVHSGVSIVIFVHISQITPTHTMVQTSKNWQKLLMYIYRHTYTFFLGRNLQISMPRTRKYRNFENILERFIIFLI